MAAATPTRQELWQKIKSNWMITWSNRIVLVCTVITAGIIGVGWTRFPPNIPLWYSLPWGADQLAMPIYIVILPLGSILTWIINFSIGKYVTPEFLVFTQVLYLSSVLVSAMSLYVVANIVLLVL